MDTLKELFKIGCGPSSSHTMGPQRAAKKFKEKNSNASSYKVRLYGSLAATGEGHLTDYIIKKTLEPKEVEIIWEPETIKEFHPNGATFIALDENKNVIDEYTVFSVGGGTIKEENEETSKEGQTYPLTTMDEIMKWCK